MRLGLLADVHEAVDLLREAIGLFRQRGVDEIVFLGDLCAMHKRLDETAALMHQERIAGVWGNHDFGLCHGHVRAGAQYSPELLAYTTTLRPSLVRDDCLFTHVEPWLDANDILQLWYFEGLPDTPAKLARSFDAVPQRVLMSGHVHRWFLAAPDGPIVWDGTTTVWLRPPARYYVTLHAVVEGHCAIYDSTTGELTPIRLTSAPQLEPARP
jgi:predicted phosphodiesterase